MSTKPVLLLDVDGVVADFHGHTLKTLKEIYQVDVDYEAVYAQWSIADAIPLKDKWCLGDMWNRDGFCRDIPLYEDAWANVTGLSKDADIYFVTSPIVTNMTWVYERSRWLKQNFGDVGRQVIHTSHKHLVRGNVFVDDKASAVATWQERNPDGIGVVWERPYNTSERPAYANLLWTNNWEVVKQLLQDMA